MRQAQERTFAPLRDLLRPDVFQMQIQPPRQRWMNAADMWPASLPTCQHLDFRPPMAQQQPDKLQRRIPRRSKNANMNFFHMSRFVLQTVCSTRWFTPETNLSVLPSLCLSVSVPPCLCASV